MKPGFEPTPEDHSSIRESSAFTSRPGPFHLFIRIFMFSSSQPGIRIHPGIHGKSYKARQILASLETNTKISNENLMFYMPLHNSMRGISLLGDARLENDGKKGWEPLM